MSYFIFFFLIYSSQAIANSGASALGTTSVGALVTFPIPIIIEYLYYKKHKVQSAFKKSFILNLFSSIGGNLLSIFFTLTVIPSFLYIDFLGRSHRAGTYEIIYKFTSAVIIHICLTFFIEYIVSKIFKFDLTDKTLLYAQIRSYGFLVLSFFIYKVLFTIL